MSLVSSLSGAITWNQRSSDLENRFAQLMEVINILTEQATNVGSAIAALDNNFNQYQSFMAMSNNNQNGQNGQNSQSQMPIFLMARQKYQYKKMALSLKKKNLEQKEQFLQKEKTKLEAQLKLSQQTAESMTKMEDAGIKRLAINV